MRNYSNFDKYYDELLGDIYAQPPDEKHTNDTKSLIYSWLFSLNITSVLDVGCGEGEAQDFFRECSDKINYEGIALGADVKHAQSKGRNVYEADFNFLELAEDNTYDLILARHALEHSPFPLITLMEWHRIGKLYLCVVLPNPEHYTFTGRNHYSVMGSHQSAWLLRRAGWKIRRFYMTNEEIWFLCQKYPRISYEGWAEVPLGQKVYAFERDKLNIKGKMITPPEKDFK